MKVLLVPPFCQDSLAAQTSHLQAMSKSVKERLGGKVASDDLASVSPFVWLFLPTILLAAFLHQYTALEFSVKIRYFC